jgi:hypothetical protein
MNPEGFFGELKRRNVYKVAVAYAVVSWLLIQIATQVFPFFEIPNWAVRLVVLLLILGFPVALILSWAFEITPEGIKRESEVAHEQSKTRHTGRRIVGLTLPVYWCFSCCVQSPQSRLDRTRRLQDPLVQSRKLRPKALLSFHSII